MHTFRILSRSLFYTYVAFQFCHSVEAQENRSQIAELVTQADAAYLKEDFRLALQNYSAAIRMGSTDSTVSFNAACCAALSGEKREAFELLGQAIEYGWLDLGQMKDDSDLDSLRGDQRWDATITRLKSMIEQHEIRWKGKAFRSKYAANLSDAEKAAGLSRLWAEVKFNFVNFHLVPDLDWDAEYINCMPKVLASKSTFEYYQLLEELVAKLEDAHTNVYLPAKLANEFYARPKIQTRLIEGKIIIVEVSDKKLEDLGIEVGQEVVTVDGQPAVEYAHQKIKPYMAASTPQDLARRMFGSWLLRGPVAERVSLGLKAADGKLTTLKVPRAAQNRLMTFLNGSAPLSLKVLDNNLAYVRLDSFSSEKTALDFERVFPKIAKSDGLILDLRENGGGNSGVGWKILGYLTDKPFPTMRWYTLQYRPTLRAKNRQPLSRFGSTGRPFTRIANEHFKKPVVMLIGPKTFSAAEDMAAAFDMLDRGKLIGLPSGGSTGQPLRFDLPGGGHARVCTKHDSYADGTEFVGKGIQPDILIEPKIQDVIDGFDRTLDAACKELLK